MNRSSPRNPRIFAALSLLISPVIAGCATLPEPAAPPAPMAAAEPGLVSAADPRAAEAGAKILRQGGSATDAAIATMLALTVVEPQSSGIGGGGFLVRGTADGAVTTLDGRETAPAAADETWFLDAKGEPLSYRDAVLTGLSVGVPGNVALAAQAHGDYGRLEWAQLFAPAIDLARNGFAVTPRLHDFLIRFENRAAASAGGRALLYDAQGKPRPVGYILRNPELAQTLERIAQRGPKAFYDRQSAAPLAQTIAAETPGKHGMSVEDFLTYSPTIREPVCATYRAHRICGMGPPSSGATTVLAILKQLEPFPMSEYGPRNATGWHLFAESQRLAYADRERYLADSDFVPVPTEWLVDDAYLARRARLIDPASTMANVAAGVAPTLSLAPPDGDEPVENGTSHFVAVDRSGTAVSYTSTIEGPFGSGLTYGGFYLNNELTDFSFTPVEDGRKVANRVEGGKRPRSSMAPTLVYGPDGKLLYALGAAGGGTIPTQVAKTLIGLIDWNLSLERALALPQLYSPGDTVVLEEGSWLADMALQLQALGHKQVTTRDLPLKLNAAAHTPAGWVGAADPRSEGVAIRE